MKVHRFQSPYKHWRSGLATELAAFALYLIAVAGVAMLLTWAL